MASDDLIELVNERMRRDGATQVEVAAACELSQPHISKVLSQRVKLAAKTAHRLTAWLGTDTINCHGSAENVIRSIADQLERLRPNRRMQLMQLLKAVERLLNE
jgi:hypothetical protein